MAKRKFRMDISSVQKNLKFKEAMKRELVKIGGFSISSALLSTEMQRDYS